MNNGLSGLPNNRGGSGRAARQPVRSVIGAAVISLKMKPTLLLACACLSTTSLPAAPKAEEYELGDGATVIETQPVTPNRSLVLWMVRPTRHPRDTPAEPYTCPEYTRGNYYSGATRVSLVDPQTRRVINTLKIAQEPGEGTDQFDLPYNIRPDLYYHVEEARKETEGKPTIMWLKDYNGDGKALEFALFDAQACMGLATTLIGYSQRQDKVIQYQTHLVVSDIKKKRSSTTDHWTDYLFSKKPTSPGSWKYEIDYRGRGGSLDKYEIHYDKQEERFEGELVETGGG
ncbi:MAG: hypothetical protein QOC70_2055 [Verrucomicrobiota bacterium]|jgi:hypothetical protein